MTACKHKWEMYTNYPPSEDKARFWKCSECGILGYRCGNRRTRLIKCHIKGCSNNATHRMWGRDYANRLKWVCPEHTSDRVVEE